jgi:hypothetical protein
MIGSAAKEVVLVLLVVSFPFSGGVPSSKSSAFLFPLLGVLRIDEVFGGIVVGKGGFVGDVGEGAAEPSSTTRALSVVVVVVSATEVLFCSSETSVKALGNGSLALARR